MNLFLGIYLISGLLFFWMLFKGLLDNILEVKQNIETLHWDLLTSMVWPALLIYIILPKLVYRLAIEPIPKLWHKFGVALNKLSNIEVLK